MATESGLTGISSFPYKNKHILLIDDDMDDQIFFREILKKLDMGLICSIANNGWEGLEKTKEIPPPDVIFVDINMPGMNGFQFLDAVKKDGSYGHIPIIMFTTSSVCADKEMAKKLGAAGFISKPNSFQLLQKALHDTLLSVFS